LNLQIVRLVTLSRPPADAFW